jgi:hypothetical protein
MYNSDRLEDFLYDVRTGPDFQGQLDYIVRFGSMCREFRESRFTVKDLKDNDKLEMLSLLVQSWPIADVRLQGSFREKDIEVEDTSDEFIKDIAEGMELKELKRSVKHSSVIFGIMLQDNLDEFEAYNEEFFVCYC